MAEGLNYGGPAEEVSQEFAIFMKQSFRQLFESIQNSERSSGQIIGDFVVDLMKLPFAVVYAIATYNPAVARIIVFFYSLFWWYFLLAGIFFTYFMLESVYKTFVSTRLALLGRLRPWGIVHRMLGVRDTLKNDARSRIITATDHFSINEVRVPMTGLLLQITTAALVDVAVAAVVSLSWPITASVFIVTTLLTLKAPSVFYTYTLVEGEKIQGKTDTSFYIDEDGDASEPPPDVADTPSDDGDALDGDPPPGGGIDEEVEEYIEDQ
jgi:hypothetical protein